MVTAISRALYSNALSTSLCRHRHLGRQHSQMVVFRVAANREVETCDCIAGVRCQCVPLSSAAARDPAYARGGPPRIVVTNVRCAHLCRVDRCLEGGGSGDDDPVGVGQ